MQDKDACMAGSVTDVKESIAETESVEQKDG